jgi:AI-2 transport protein TqsA
MADAPSASLPRGLIALVTLAAATITVAGLHSAAGIVGPVFLALVLTIAVHPIRTRLAARGVPGWIGTVVGMLAVYVILFALATALVVAVARFATLVPTYQDEFDGLLDDVRSALSDAGVGSDQITSLSDSVDLSRLGDYLADLLGELFGVLSSLAFVVALLFFMSLEASGFTDRMGRILPGHGALAPALNTFAHGTRVYLVVSTIFGLIVAVIDSAFLWLIGIPLPLVWGLLAFITNYIPNIGFVLGLVPPALLALLEDGPGTMLVVIAVYSVINFVIQELIQPKYVGDAVGLSGTITLVSLVFWGWALGALGALLAVPLTLLVMVLIDADPRTTWMHSLVSSPGQGAPNQLATSESGSE